MAKENGAKPHVLIMGGGPAGSTMGCYLSLAGFPNTIIERDEHPRPHVGESMVMSTVRIFEDIGLLETMEVEGFPKKYGASWHPADRIAEFDIAFSELPQEGIHQDYTYHVDRARFDEVLIERAMELGSVVRQNTAVKSVVFDDRGFAAGAVVEHDGVEETIDADIVVDASGRSTIIGRHFRWKNPDPIFNQFAVHAWFEDLDRGEGRTEDYIHIYFLPAERGWAWQIPITDTITSMGVVTEAETFRGRKEDREDFFLEMVASNPGLAKAMAPAKRCNEYKSEGNYSYSLERFVGDGFLVIGDAARFVDPIFSSGVSVAMHSAKFATEAIVEAAKTGDYRGEAFEGYEKTTKEGVAIWYDFIRLYYKLLPAFTRFIQEPEHRLGLLRLLQGDVYDREEVPVLEAMRDFIKVVESNEDHLLHNALSDVPID